MSKAYRFKITVEVDVTDAESESVARRTAFNLLSASTTPLKGRPTSGPKAHVTSVMIPPVPYECLPVTSAADVLE